MFKTICEKYKHALLLLYFPVYMAVFSYVQNVVPDQIHIINCSLDQYIPFCEYFVVPYLLWFLYMGVAGLFFLFFDNESFCKMMYMGMIGMTTFLVISIVYPNGLELRPESFAHESIFTALTKMIYNADPARNVLPSIHVFNSVGIYLCISRSKALEKRNGVKVVAFILTVLIVLSTMFLKQHSLFDVISALVLVSFSYEMVYNYKYQKQWRQIKLWFLIRKKKARYKY